MNPFFFRLTIGATASMMVGLRVLAAPLTWFPGPPLRTQVSGAAALADSSLGNVLIGGDSYFNYPENLVVTNASWNILPALSGVRIGAGVGSGGDPIVVFGGTDGTTPLNTAINYSPSGDAVTPVPSMSVARAYLGYAADRSGNAYAIGGLDASSNVLSSAESLNQDSGSAWSAIASMPSGRYSFPAVYDGTNYIYVFGGYTDTIGTETATAYRYSISGNTWMPITSMPTAVAGSSAAFGVDGKIYVVGGVSNGVSVATAQIYDPGSNSWIISTPLPEGLSGSAMGVDSLGRLIVMGGADTNGLDVADVWRSQQLGIPDVAPTFTQYPGTNANYGATYTSTIAATGAPPPTYVVVNGPTNMAVDTFSGVITWTPQGASQIGAIPVTIRATNYAGYVDWNYTINAAPPPPTAPTNLTVVAVTDTSITLSWAPEDPLVGPVTYTASAYVYTGGAHGRYIFVPEVTGITNPTVTITGLTPATAHSYGVAAILVNGPSPTNYSGVVSATTTSPQPPQNVQVTGITSSTISFGWNPSPGPAQSPNYSAITSYTIAQYIPGGTVVPKLTGITGTSGTLTGVAPRTSAFWTIQAVDAQGLSSSPLADILTVSNPVPNPAVLSAPARTGTGGLQFTIQIGAAQTTYIQVTTNLSDPSSWVTIATNPPSTTAFSFTDTNSAVNQMLFYRVLSP